MKRTHKPHSSRQDGFRGDQKPAGKRFYGPANNQQSRPGRGRDAPRSEASRDETSRREPPKWQGKPRHEKPRLEKKFDKNRSENPRSDRPDFEKPKFDKPRFEKKFDRNKSDSAHSDNARPDKPRFDKPKFDRPKFDKPRFDKPRHSRPRHEKPKRETAPREGILLWGTHAVRAAWLNPNRRCIRLWVTENAATSFAATISEGKLEAYKRPDPKRVTRDELDELTPPGSVHQGIVLEAAALPEPALHEVITAENPPDLLLVLDQVTDPHNVGAIARSAAAFGAGGIVMTERNAPGLTGVLAKSASGALEHVPLIHIVNLARALEELQHAGYWCVGLAEEGARDLGALDLSGRTALVLGAEGEGLRQLTRKKCDELARLPTGGALGSLNVSNAAAVALYEVRRQKGKFA